MKKVLIISSSPRKNSNSEALCKAFAEGAKESGHEVELVSLRDKTINFCRGCFACQKTKKCVIRDDAIEICQKALEANVLVFATPPPEPAVSERLCLHGRIFPFLCCRR